MNSLKWPGELIFGRQPYREIGDDASSDIGSEEHLLDKKDRGPTFKRDQIRPPLLSVAAIFHLTCFIFYTILFFVLSVSMQRKCADDQTQVWCKSGHSQ